VTVPDELFIERRVSALEGSHNYVKSAVDEIVGKLDKILEQNTRVAVLAEKQATHQVDLDRAYARISAVEEKHASLLQTVTTFISFISGLTKLAYVLWTTLSGVTLIILVKMLFFMGAKGFMP
jgi:hypothetical protein